MANEDRKVTALQLRLAEAAETIARDDPERLAFTHSVLAQIGLPRRRVSGETFERTSGNASLLVTAGRLWNGKRWIAQSLPYGTRPRLALFHICAEAVRTGSPEIDVGRSVREFLLRIGIAPDGDGYRSFQTQMRALAACDMRLGIGMETIKAQPIERFEAWLHPTGGQEVLWPGVLTLSAQFFEGLQAHAIPLDPRAVAALSHSALALDTYAWLAHRLCRVRRDGTRLTWTNLREQFGQEYQGVNATRNFKREFRQALKAALAVYPSARVEAVTGGIALYASAPPIQKTQISIAVPFRPRRG